jgi:quinol monooxygenase YgiN
MAVRLVITFAAVPGKGAELARLLGERSREVAEEPGCEQFEAFQSALDPDRVILLELWADQAALDVHAKLNTTRPPMPDGLLAGPPHRDDYKYSRTR